MKIIDKDLNAPLSKEIETQYSKLIDALLQIPPSARSLNEVDGTGGKVSVNNIIAYQIGWGKLLISWYEDALNGKTPLMPGEGFTKWDYVGLAHHFYNKYHYKNDHEQEQQFFEVVKKIITIVEKEYARGNLDKLDTWSWCILPSGKKWPFSKWIRVNTVSPYKRASVQLRKLIKTNKYT